MPLLFALLLLLEQASAVPSHPAAAAGPLSVIDFGARGDGSADDHDADCYADIHAHRAPVRD